MEICWNCTFWKHAGSSQSHFWNQPYGYLVWKLSFLSGQNFIQGCFNLNGFEINDFAFAIIILFFFFCILALWVHNFFLWELRMYGNFLVLIGYQEGCAIIPNNLISPVSFWPLGPYRNPERDWSTQAPLHCIPRSVLPSLSQQFSRGVKTNSIRSEGALTE